MHWSSFPQLKLVESVGNAPTSTCLQGRCIACLPRPQRKTGKSPWCCPRQAEFWRLCRTGWCATYWKMVRLPGIASGWWPCASTSVAGDILLLNHSREIERAGSVHAPGPRLGEANNE